MDQSSQHKNPLCSSGYLEIGRINPIFQYPSYKDNLFTVPEKYTCLADCWDEILSKYPGNKVLEETTFLEVDEKMKRVGSCSQTTIFLDGKNYPNWTIIDVACWNDGITKIPLYNTLGEEAFERILKITEGTAILTK